MEKYAKLKKGLEMCAGPSCCKDGCPYYGETTGAMTCRARLLRDAEIAINNEQALHESAEGAIDDLEAENKTIRDERDGLKEYALVLEKEGQEARARGDKLAADNMELRKECDMLATRCTVLQNEANSLLLKWCKQNGETDRTSVSDEALKSEYKRGYLDAMEYCFRELCKRAGGGCCHE